MPRPKVSLLVHDVHAPTIGAAIRIARMLQPDYDYEIVGPDLGHGICSMYRDEPGIKAVACPRIYRLPDYFAEVRRLAQAITGDVLIPLKAYADTLWLALNIRKASGVPVVAYLDEWDGALWAGWSWRQKIKAVLSRWQHPLDEHYAPWLERSIRRTNAVVCSSSFLARKFCGQVIPMGVDTGFFSRPDEALIHKRRAELGLLDKRVIVFGGVARPHKGLETVLAGMALRQDAALRLLVVGPVTDYLAALMVHPAYRGWLCCAGDSQYGGGAFNQQVHQHLPEYLGVGDIFAVPLADGLLARSQVPIKVYEAMAMGRPVMGSAVSDLPEILKDCGWVVPPGDAGAWAAGIREIEEHPEVAATRARAARQRCEQEYSLAVARQRWMQLLSQWQLDAGKEMRM